VVVAGHLLTDQMRVAMNDLGLLPLHPHAAKALTQDHPRNGVTLPPKALMLVDDRQVHGHEDPSLTSNRTLDLPDHVRVGPARNAVVADSRRIDSAIMQSGDQARVGELLVEDEDRHAAPSKP
jgi:hypothetical protein